MFDWFVATASCGSGGGGLIARAGYRIVASVISKVIDNRTVVHKTVEYIRTELKVAGERLRSFTDV